MNEMLEFIKKYENGVTEQMLCSNFPGLTKGEIAGGLNGLLQQNQIEIVKESATLSKGKGRDAKDNYVLYYKVLQNKNIGYEALILNLIGLGGSSGLWLKDIKSKTNIPHNLVLKILKVLEDTRKIKSIKSVKNNRKTYVLYDIKPDEDVSGGVWFSNNDVDLVFVNKLMDVIYHFISKSGMIAEEGSYTLNKIDNLVKLRSIKDFIAGSGISEVELSMEDINTLIDGLVYDGRIEKLEVGDGVALRALVDSYMKL